MKTQTKSINLVLMTLLFFVFSVVGQGQNLVLSSTNVAPANYIHLQWTWTPSQPSATYGFTLFQWDDVLANWQSTSIKCNDTIRVLNVYPNVAGSNTLATWMHNPAIGFGKILVTSVSITNFNNNPDSYLKDASGNYKYDVIMFGSWDANNLLDINLSAATAVRFFLDAGHGVLFGHDTQTSNPINSSGSRCTNFISLSDKTNLDIDPTNHRPYLWRGSTNIRVVNNGYLLNYPHFIPYNVDLTIPLTHTSGQTAKGIVWMNFPDTIGAQSYCVAASQIVNGGTNNFYLTTWNNAAMIQVGHSNGQATTDERKILANTLWYLAQFTTDTTTDACSARDITPPAAPIANWSSKCNQLNISTCDSGTVYKFYVKAINMVNNNDTIISNQLTVENKTGLRGYFISEDANPNGVPTVVRNASNIITTPVTITASDCISVTYTVQNPSHYIHIQAVDYADNLSTVTTVKASDLQSVSTFFDTICPNNPYKNYGFNIPADSLQTVGTFEFRDTIPSTTGCDTIVILNLNVKDKDTTQFNITICEGEIYQENGFNCSKTDTYFQN
jgi:hypothetical protein